MNIFFVVSVFVFAALCFLSERKKLINDSFATPAFFKVICAVCSVAMIVNALNSLIDESSGISTLLVALFSVLSAAYFSIFLFKNQPRSGALLALCPIALSTAMLAITYFDVYVEMNSPNKVLIQFACIASMLGFLGEARLLADNKKRKAYFFFIACALFFSTVSSISAVILYFSNTLNYSYVKFDCILFVFSLYFIARMLTVCSDKKSDNSESEFAKDISAE
jgi:hypothetical protein